MNEKLINEVVEEIVQSKLGCQSKYVKDGDPRWIYI